MKRNGFSLIELLLAMGIFSVVALSLYSAFATGMRLSRRSEKVDRVYREARWAIQKMAVELENMAQYNFRNSYPEKTAFVGAADHCSFLVDTDKGLKVVKFYLKSLEFGSVHKTIIGEHYEKNVAFVTKKEKTAKTYALVREEKDFSEDLTDSSLESKISVLSSKITEAGLNFSYAYREGFGQEAETVWKDVWGQDYIPSGIRIELVFINPRGKEGRFPVRRTVFVPTGSFGRESSEE